ncbi:XdhC/CoxI family protein [Tepidiforma flava]|uniref:XdhC/CoxI family protein n=1 Tax=Tepidiforma flava TaxID=3004094 RepID=A0ABY7M2S3_9CHLR|nr:XdhC/CoxI family protein [Tepidiforma flava]WBL34959.1 XdhC/CoxI family protein [Tepidiforma flava]
MLELTQRLAAAAEGGEPVLLAVLVDPGALPLQPGARLLIEPGGSTLGTLGEPALDAAAAGRSPPTSSPAGRPRTRATSSRARSANAPPRASLPSTSRSSPRSPPSSSSAPATSAAPSPAVASFLGYRVAVLDDRPDYADPQLIPEADEVICGMTSKPNSRAFPSGPIPPSSSSPAATSRTSSRSAHASAAAPAYLGMIGSRRRTTAVLDHLRAEGFPEAELDRVRTPIGLDIGAETPEEIAISIIAEVILLRRGGTGAPLYYRARRSATPARS